MSRKPRKKRLNSLSSVRKFLAEQINKLQTGEVTQEELRVYSYACSIISSILKDSDIEKRLKQLEKTLKEEEEQQQS